MQENTDRKYGNRIRLPGSKKECENIPVEDSRLPRLLYSSGCGGGVWVVLGVRLEVECGWGWGSSAMGLEFEFNIRVLQSSEVVPSVRPRGQRGLFYLRQCFSTFVRPRPGKFFFHKTRARSEQIYS